MQPRSHESTARALHITEAMLLQKASLGVGWWTRIDITDCLRGSWEMMTELGEEPEAGGKPSLSTKVKKKFLRGDDQDRCHLRMSPQPHSTTHSPSWASAGKGGFCVSGPVGWGVGFITSGEGTAP